MRRPESTIAVLDALEAGRVTLAQLGPGNVARLRTHPNRKMAERAATLIDRLTPNARERAEALHILDDFRLLKEKVQLLEADGVAFELLAEEGFHWATLSLRA